MKKKRTLKAAKKLTALLLCLVMTWSGAELFTVAAETQSPETTAGSEGANSIEEQLSTFLSEKIDTQNAVEILDDVGTAPNEVALQLSDGTVSVYCFSEPIKYEDEAGEVHFKETEIVEQDNDDFSYTNGDNEFSIDFSEDVDKGVKIVGADSELTLIPVQNENVEQHDGESKAIVNADNNTEDVFAYENVFGEGSRIEYSPQLNGLKENIILDQYTGQNTFDFILNTNGDAAELIDGNVVVIKAKETGEVVSELLPLFAYDSYDDAEYSVDPTHYTEDCVYTLAQQDDGTYKLTVVVSEEWLTASTTVYPVTIDPTITNNYTGMDCALYSAKPDQVFSTGYTTNNTGYNSTYGKGRTMFKFAMPSEIPTGAVIDAARYYFRETTAKTDTTYVGAHMINSVANGWTSAIATWNKYYNACDAQLSRRNINSTSTDVSGSSYWYKFDIRAAVQKWINGQAANRGIMLVSESESTTGSWRAWASIRHGTSSYKPYANIMYEVDNTAPVINYTLTPPAGTWTSGSVTLSISVTDAGGGVASYSIDGAAVTSKTYSANATATIKAKDYAGHETTKTVTISNIDKIPAISSVTVSPTGWTNGDITVTHTAASSLSPVSKYQYAISTSSTTAPTASNAFTDLPSPTALSHVLSKPIEGTQYVWVRAVSAVGNGTPKCAGTAYKRDATSPVIPAKLEFVVDQAVPGNKKLIWSGVTDAHSGVAKLEYKHKLPGGSYRQIPQNEGIYTGNLNAGSYSFPCPADVTAITVKITDNVGLYREISTDLDLHAPENFVAKAMVSMSTRLTWVGDDSTGVTYDIYASDTASGTFEEIAQDITGNYWFDYTVRQGTRYYKVKAKAHINGQLIESPFTAVQSASSISLSIANSYIGVRAHEQLLPFEITSGTGMVHPKSGNLYYSTMDASTNSATEPITFVRSYNSLGNYSNGLGNNWDHSLNIMLLKQYDVDGNETGILFKSGDGGLNVFEKKDGIYTRPAGLYAWLTQGSNGNYILTFKDQTKYYFNKSNQLEEIENQFGKKTVFEYRSDGNLVAVKNNVTNSAEEAIGDTLTIAYQEDKTDMIASVTAAGVTTYYEYDSDDRLKEVYKVNDGERLSEKYDYTNGKLTSITNANGQSYRVAYSGDKASSVTDPKSQIFNIIYSRDVDANYIVTGSFLGKITQQYYTENMGLFAIAENGRITSYEYDADYNVTKVTTPGQKVTQSTYDARGNILTSTAPGNLVTYYEYDQGRDVPKKVDAPHNGSTRHVTVSTYNSYDQILTSYVVGSRQKTFNTYDANGNLTQTVQVTGNGAEALTTYAQATGNSYYVQETQYTYDEKDRLIRTIQIGDTYNRVTEQTYDDESNQVTAQSDGEIESEFDYDDVGQMVESFTTDSEEMITETETAVYDAMGNVVEQTSPAGTATTEYDNLGRVVKTTDESGLITQTAYTDKSDGTRYTVTTQTKDGVVLNKNLSVCDKWGNEILSGAISIHGETGLRVVEGYTLLSYVENAYDVDGKKTTSVDESGVTAQSTYDARDNLISQTMSKEDKSETIFSTYDDVGNPLTETAADGKVTTYIYDVLGRMLKTTLSKGSNSLCTATAEYDRVVNGQLVIIDKDAKERSISRYTNKLGDLIKETVGTKSTVSEYDEDGHLLSSTLTDTAYPNKSSVITYEYTGSLKTKQTYAPGHYVTYTYDDQGKLLTETVTKNTWSHTTAYTYDNATAKVLSMTRNGDRTEYAYTPTGNLETITYATGDIVKYEYNSEGQAVLTRHNNLPIQSYEYNAAGQLANVKAYNGQGNTYISESRTYDWKGNIASKTYYDNQGYEREKYDLTYAYDKIVSETCTTNYGVTPIVIEKEYEYDWLDRLITEIANGAATGYTYDQVGNRLSLTSGNNVYTYTYNDSDQLLTEKRNNVLSQSYTYDLNGNQTRKIEGSVTTEYVFDAANHLEKVMQGLSTLGEYTYDAAGQRLSKTVDNLMTSYYYDGINLLYTKENDLVNEIALRKSSGGLIMSICGGSKYFYRTDIRGSISNILDNSQTVVKSYSYDAYGNTSTTSSTFKSNFAYTGAVLDGETGLYYLNARYYDPATARFVSEDPARDGDSWYMYCQGDPVNHIDPTGCYNISSFNCYAYAFGINNRWMIPGKADNRGDLLPTLYYVEQVVNWVLKTFSKARSVSSKSSTLNSGEYLIATRVEIYTVPLPAKQSGPLYQKTYDFHFWKKNPKNGEWWDKPGGGAIRKKGNVDPNNTNNWYHKTYYYSQLMRDANGNTFKSRKQYYNSGTRYIAYKGTFWSK